MQKIELSLLLIKQILPYFWYNIIRLIKKKFIPFMSTITVLKNQKANKIKKYHMKSILSEVKNKTMIEDIDNERKYTEDKIIKRWVERKKS